MSADNKYRPHVLVLPEDDANRDIAVGFRLQLANERSFQILRVAGGWAKVIDNFRSDQLFDMERNSNRFMILLLDFDGMFETRMAEIQKDIPEHLADRVFVIGSLSEPESLKKAGLGKYEEIGLALADDCRDETNNFWGHELLRHNEPELTRLRESVRPFLFS